MPSERSKEDRLSDPRFIRIMRETLYDMTLERLNAVWDDDDEDEGDLDESAFDEEEHDSAVGDQEEEEDDLEIEQLEAFLAGGLGPDRSFDLGTLESMMGALPVMSEEREDTAGEVREKRLAQINDCMRALILLLADLKNRYALLWARGRLAEKRSPAGDEEPVELFVRVGDDQSQRITLPMKVDDEEKKELDELMAVINQRTTNVARADDVTVRVHKRRSPFDNFLLVHGNEQMAIEVASVKPFSRKRLADPSFLESVVTAVNEATALWRTRISRTPEEIEAQRDKRMARIERKYPQYWGPHDAGAMICVLGALFQYAEVTRLPEVHQRLGKGGDPHACFADGWPALKAVSELLDEKLREGGDPHQDLEDVKPARQFFLSPLIGDHRHVPEDLQPLTERVHQLITKEVELDRDRRRAHTSSTTETAARQLRLTHIANTELVEENKLGRVVISGSCVLLRLEPNKRVTTEKKLLKLLNAAFERANRARGAASMSFF